MTALHFAAWTDANDANTSGKVQRRHTDVVLGVHVDTIAGVEQHVHDLEAVVTCCVDERRGIVRPLAIGALLIQIDRRTMIDEKTDEFFVLVARLADRPNQRRLQLAVRVLVRDRRRAEVDVARLRVLEEHL